MLDYVKTSFHIIFELFLYENVKYTCAFCFVEQKEGIVPMIP